MSALIVNNLSVTARNIQLLKKVSFIVNAGEIMAIIGPNGAGKTILMNTILNIEFIENHNYQCSGQLNVCGHSVLPKIDIGKWTLKTRARHIALLPQVSLLNFPFTVMEVVQLSRIPHNTGIITDEAIIRDILVRLDIAHLSRRLYTQLSGGEKQRVQLARVMAQIWRSEDANTGARLLLLDEPTSSLDLGHQQQLMQVVKYFSNQGVAVVMVLHDVNLLASYADSVLALLGGEVIAQGTPQMTITSTLMRTLYHANIDVVVHPIRGNLTITY